MNPMMATTAAGTRRRLKPVRSSGIGVVAVTAMLAAPPSVAFASTFQLAHSPSIDRLIPSTEVVSPSPMNGNRKAKATKGRIAARRPSTTRGVRRATTNTPRSTAASTANAITH